MVGRKTTQWVDIKLLCVRSYMAFDMYLDGKNEKIHYSEEDFFMIVTKEDGFPNLEWLWEEFYNGPEIDGQRAKLIAEELEMAKNHKRIKSRHSLVKFIDRVRPFFGDAAPLLKV